MSNIVTLHTEMRWKAVIEYIGESGPFSVDHYFEEISDLHNIIEHGPDWNTLIRCTVTLNRSDNGAVQNSVEKAVPNEHG